MDYSAIVVAAGTGERSGLGYNKVLSKLGDSTVIEQSVSKFIEDDDCKEIILVVKKEEQEDFEHILNIDKVIYAYGGATRSDSVYSGLSMANSEYVMIHDGARPYLSKQELVSLKDELVKSHACLLVVPVIDTIKIIDDGVVSETPQRSRLFAAHTPQCFKRTEIVDAYDKMMVSDIPASDDAMVMERFGVRKVTAVIGSYNNVKVTLPQDFS